MKHQFTALELGIISFAPHSILETDDGDVFALLMSIEHQGCQPDCKLLLDEAAGIGHFVAGSKCEGYVAVDYKTFFNAVSALATGKEFGRIVNDKLTLTRRT